MTLSRAVEAALACQHVKAPPEVTLHIICPSCEEALRSAVEREKGEPMAYIPVPSDDPRSTHTYSGSGWMPVYSAPVPPVDVGAWLDARAKRLRALAEASKDATGYVHDSLMRRADGCEEAAAAWREEHPNG